MNQRQADTRLKAIFQKLSKLKEAVADLKTATQAHTQQTQDFVNEAKKMKKQFV